MFSKWKQSGQAVKDAVLKQRKLALIYLLWSVLCSLWGSGNNFEMIEYYQYESSIVDLMIGQQPGVYVGLTIFPFAVFLVMRCKKDCINTQFLMRYGNRREMFLRQMMESALYSAGLTIALLLVQIFTAALKCGSLINWTREESYYCAKTGLVAEANFFIVCGAVFLMYFVKFMIIFTLMDIFSWYPQYMVLIWIFLVVTVGCAWLAEIDFLHEVFSFQYRDWRHPGRYGAVLLTGLFLILAEAAAGVGIIRKKDIFV